jgi:hypothetical protein
MFFPIVPVQSGPHEFQIEAGVTLGALKYPVFALRIGSPATSLGIPQLFGANTLKPEQFCLKPLADRTFHPMILPPPMARPVRQKCLSRFINVPLSLLRQPTDLPWVFAHPRFMPKMPPSWTEPVFDSR